MTDIVKRLRRYCADTGIKSRTIDEAADEIERLREALTRIANYPIHRPYFGKGGATIPETMRNIARAALEESK